MSIDGPAEVDPRASVPETTDDGLALDEELRAAVDRGYQGLSPEQGGEPDDDPLGLRDPRT